MQRITELWSMLPHNNPAPAKSRSVYRWIVWGTACALLFIIGHKLVERLIEIRKENHRETVYRTKRQIKEFMMALDLYKMDHGTYPVRLQDLTTTAPKPYLCQIPLDMWGHPYLYIVNGTSRKIISYGADGKEGGTGTGEDIIAENNW